MNLYLTGFMATGKSTIGKELARRLDLLFIDTDTEITKREDTSIPEIFNSKGEAYFRNAESKLLAELAQNGKQQVIATGGGLIIRPDNLQVMKQTGFLIGLFADKEVIMQRVTKQSGRPLLAGDDRVQRIQSLLLERKKFYLQADIQIDTSCREKTEIVAEILAHPSFPLR
jgi:shikimate kinase